MEEVMKCYLCDKEINTDELIKGEAEKISKTKYKCPECVSRKPPKIESTALEEQDSLDLKPYTFVKYYAALSPIVFVGIVIWFTKMAHKVFGYQHMHLAKLLSHLITVLGFTSVACILFVIPLRFMKKTDYENGYLVYLCIALLLNCFFLWVCLYRFYGIGR